MNLSYLSHFLSIDFHGTVGVFSEMAEIESALGYLGRPGAFHVLVFICLGLNNLVVVLNHLAMVVFAPKTPFKCHIPEELVNRTNMENVLVTSSECSLYVNRSINGTWTTTEYDCPGHWDYEVTDNEYSVIMQVLYLFMWHCKGLYNNAQLEFTIIIF